MAGTVPDTNPANGDEREPDVESSADADLPREARPSLQEGVDYYLENGWFVFTAAFLQKRGYCCESGCRHCPYPKK
jgi:hypothetical protein